MECYTNVSWVVLKVKQFTQKEHKLTLTDTFIWLNMVGVATYMSTLANMIYFLRQFINKQKLLLFFLVTIGML